MSRTVIVGDITDYNIYVIQELRSKYNKAFIRTVKNIKELEKLNNSPPPILGMKYLLEMDIETFSKSANNLLDKIDGMKNNPYVDILIRLKIKGPVEIITQCKIINLNKTKFIDFKRYIMKDLEISEELAKIVVNKIGLSLQAYNLYRYKLMEVKPLDKKKIDTIIKYKKSKPLLEVLEGILMKQSRAYRSYQNSVYPEAWFRDFFIDELTEIIDLKIQIRNRQKGISDIRSNDKTRKYGNIVSNVPITNCFLLRQLLLQYKQGGIERYFMVNIEEFMMHMMPN